MNRLNGESDKEINRERYEQQALGKMRSPGAWKLSVDGARAVPLELRAPYVAFERRIQFAVTGGTRVLDVCAGTGLHSFTALRAGGRVSLTDISAAALDVARARIAAAGFQAETVVADAEALPFPSATFDVVTCAGAISYLDPNAFFPELLRVLKPNGRFIAVDSFNHNPVYRLNRWLQVRRGQRTRSTLERMPDERLLARLRELFRRVDVQYYGIFSFLSPLLKPIVGQDVTARWLDSLDVTCPAFRRYAFKVVIECECGGS
jgi:SAM-dependent methyltransferase